jgi:hypothetical protein
MFLLPATFLIPRPDAGQAAAALRDPLRGWRSGWSDPQGTGPFDTNVLEDKQVKAWKLNRNRP